MRTFILGIFLVKKSFEIYQQSKGIFLTEKSFKIYQQLKATTSHLEKHIYKYAKKIIVRISTHSAQGKSDTHRRRNRHVIRKVR